MAESTGIRARWDRLSERERRLVLGLGVTFVLCATAVVAFLVNDGLSTLETENQEMRQALRDMESGRDVYLRAQRKARDMEARLGGGNVQLQGYLEQAAKEVGVEIAETTERQPAPVGKGYLERAVDVRLQKVKLGELAKFLKRVETGPPNGPASLVVVTALNVRVRDDKHEDLEVEMTASTYEKAPQDKGGKKGAGKEQKGALLDGRSRLATERGA